MTANGTPEDLEQDGAPLHDSMDRRNAMRVLSTLVGAAVGSLVVPPRWSTPRLEFGLLPAHAVTSRNPNASLLCGTGAASVDFDSGSPATAGFSCSPYDVSTNSSFQVRFDAASNAVTVQAVETGFSVVSASVGSVTGGVLTYTWSANNPINTLNLLISYQSATSAAASYRVTVDIEIATVGGQASTLAVRNLTSVPCSFN